MCPAAVDHSQNMSAGLCRHANEGPGQSASFSPDHLPQQPQAFPAAGEIVQEWSVAANRHRHLAMRLSYQSIVDDARWPPALENTHLGIKQE
jgi:hypothetical protein